MKRIVFFVLLIVSARAFSLPEIMLDHEDGIWRANDSGLAWSQATATAAPAGILFRCFEDLNMRVATIYVYFDKTYPENAEILIPTAGLEKLSLEETSQPGRYELKPIDLGINILYQSPDNAILPVIISAGDTRDVYAFSMQKSSGAAKKVLEHCGALK